MIVFIIPAYNEEAHIAILLENIAKVMERAGFIYQVIVVNDGSRDRTREIVEFYQETMPILLINHPTNCGVGQVFRTGFQRALEITEDDDLVVTMEADNTSDIHILDSMIQKTQEGYDLVLASCYAKGGGIENTTLLRLIYSKTANFMIRVLFKLRKIHTLTSFYRVYRVGLLKRTRDAYQGNLIEQQGFSCMVELLLKLIYCDAKVIEVPMVLRCQMRQDNSKMKVKKTIIEHLKLGLNYGILQRRRFVKRRRTLFKWRAVPQKTTSSEVALIVTTNQE